jgi:2-desacetyl-2-hydroxyethyl bacteriochlorophyllide A dehydrogenase
MRAKVVCVTGVDEVNTAFVELPDPSEGEVLVETVYSGISPGTELRCLSGKQGGDAVFPFIPGYAMVVRVLRNGSAQGLAEGTLCFLMGSAFTGPFHRAWGGHMSHAVCKTADLQPIPEGVPPVQAAVAKMASIPFHGLRLAAPRLGEQVAVIGLGPVGHMAARLYALSGAATAACDTSEKRVNLARKAGINAIVVEDSLPNTFRKIFPDGADIVVDCTGVESLVRDSISLCRELPWGDHLIEGPRLVIQGSYPENFSVPYDPAFLRELKILLPRSEQDRDRVSIFGLIREGRIDLGSIISEIQSPEDAAGIYSRLRDRNSGLMTAVFDWRACGTACRKGG